MNFKNNPEIKLNENLVNSLDSTIKNDEKLIFNIIHLSDFMEQKIQESLTKILEQHEKIELHTTIYTCLKELLVNAIKANLKTAYFIEHDWDINNSDDYEKGTKKYKIDLGESLLEQHLDVLITNNHVVSLEFTYSKEGMLIEVINMTPMSIYDELKLREKLKYAMKADDIADYFINYGNDTEGAGIGLALLILLLKGEGIDPSLFRVGVIGDKTVARLEIPFTDNYISIRKNI